MKALDMKQFTFPGLSHGIYAYLCLLFGLPSYMVNTIITEFYHA